MEAKTVFIGKSDSCDFEQQTWTFSFDGEFFVGAGEYAIMRRCDYQRLLASGLTMKHQVDQQEE